jgi:hypothetical protein
VLRRRLGPLAIAFVAGLGAPLAATAAVSYRITTEPPDPRVGESVTILVATFAYVDPPATPNEPLALEAFPWTFVAESPTGERRVIALQRDGTSTDRWTGRFTFDEPGHWEIGLDEQHLGAPVDPALGARLPVEVRSGDEPTGVALAVLVLAVAAIASVVLLRMGLTLIVGERRGRRAEASGGDGTLIHERVVDRADAMSQVEA